MNEIPVITIDGPSGVGKGTLANFLCQVTGFHLLDSGAIYRALAYAVGFHQIALDNVPGLVALAETLAVSFEGEAILYQQQDITSKVRTEEVAAIASKIAAIPEIRAALLSRQRDFVQSPGLVADGRDMGTVVFKNANLKLFLTASAEARAKRRVNQLKNQGVSVSIRDIEHDIEARDQRDMTRSSSPLVAAEDAILIDTTEMDIDAVCQLAENALREARII